MSKRPGPGLIYVRQVRNHFNTLIRGELFQNEVVGWWSLLEWSKWTMMDDQTLRCRLKWQKPGAVPGYWGLLPLADALHRWYIYTYTLRMIDRWPPREIGVLFAVGDRSYGALPSARITQLVVSYLGHGLMCLVILWVPYVTTTSFYLTCIYPMLPYLPTYWYLIGVRWTACKTR